MRALAIYIRKGDRTLPADPEFALAVRSHRGSKVEVLGDEQAAKSLGLPYTPMPGKAGVVHAQRDPNGYLDGVVASFSQSTMVVVRDLQVPDPT